MGDLLVASQGVTEDRTLATKKEEKAISECVAHYTDYPSIYVCSFNTRIRSRKPQMLQYNSV